MLKTRVIPCMLFNGLNLVKTIKFDRMRNLGNPVQAAHVYNSRNVDELIFLDILASQESRGPMLEIVQEILRECYMPLTIGGGIRKLDDINALLSIGADKICINSAAVLRPEFVQEAAKKFGNQCIVVSIDAKKDVDRYFVYTHRGTVRTNYELVDYARRMQDAGAGEIFLNAIDRDGTMIGYDVDLIRTVCNSVTIPVIACGGAGKVQDIIDAVQQGGANAVALASMFHYSGHTANSIKLRMRDAGIPVRIVGNDEVL